MHPKWLYRLVAPAFVLVLVCTTLVSAGDFSIVQPNGAVFIGEEGLDITSALGFDEPSSCVLEFFAPGTNKDTDVPSATKYVPDTSDFNVLSADFSGKTGVWYRSDNKTNYIRVEEPRIAVYLRDGAGNDITGKTVTRGAGVNFRVETNLYEIQKRNTSSKMDFDIKVEAPGGIVYTSLFIDSATRKDIVDLPVSTGLWLWSSYTPAGLWNLSVRDSSGNMVYGTGKYYVSAECNENKLKTNNPRGVSDRVEFSIASESLRLSVDKLSVTRGEQFVVTVSGVPSTVYTLYVKSVGADVAPKIISGQRDVTPDATGYNASVKTSSSGTVSVGFSTNTSTRAKRWTIRVEDPTDLTKSDEIYVNVRAGEIVLSASGPGVYYLGQEVRLYGTCTASDKVYFFITGPNLPTNGGDIRNPRSTPGFVSVDVKDDDTFEYKWNTESLSIDAGAYTVYAVSMPVTKDKIDDAVYATVSINFRKPYVSASVVPSNVASGQKFRVKGDAGVETPTGVAVWIMGKNYVSYKVVSVEPDGKFDYEVKPNVNLAPGQYFVVVQHPMYDGKFDVYPDSESNPQTVLGTYPTRDSPKFKIGGTGALQGSDAANALVSAIDDPAVDDVYARVQFMVAQPFINVDPIKKIQIGKDFTVKGKTNLAAGTTLIVEVVSASFGPTKKTTTGEFSGFSGTTKVVSGEGEFNEFEITASSSNFIEDEYIVTVSAVDVDVSGTTSFLVAKHVPTPTPTHIPTPLPTTEIMTPPTTIPTPPPTIPTTIPTPIETPPEPTETQSPGFGAVIAAAGICIVAYFVTRNEKR